MATQRPTRRAGHLTPRGRAGVPSGPGIGAHAARRHAVDHRAYRAVEKHSGQLRTVRVARGAAGIAPPDITGDAWIITDSPRTLRR